VGRPLGAELPRDQGLHDFRGGAIICGDAKTKQRIDYLKNFGFADELTVVAPGINGKMNEMQAAFGLLELRYVDGAIARRRSLDTIYRQGLAGVPGVEVPALGDWQHNYGYFPIFVGPPYPLARDALYEQLKGKGHLRTALFYPLISEFPMYRGLPSAAPERLPVAHGIAERVLCLPLYRPHRRAGARRDRRGAERLSVLLLGRRAARAGHRAVRPARAHFAQDLALRLRTHAVRQRRAHRRFRRALRRRRRDRAGLLRARADRRASIGQYRDRTASRRADLRRGDAALVDGSG
jgi:hypothetical protein